MGASVKETLKGMQGLWDKSQAAFDTMFGGAKVPQNTYNAKLTQCFIRNSQAGNPYVGREFTIMDGEQEGAKVFDRLMLHTDNGPVFLRRFIDQCAYEQPKKVEDLETVINAIHKLGLEFQIKVVHNGDFTNVQILKSLSEVEAEAPAGDAGTDTDTGAAGDASTDTGDDTFRQTLIAFARGQQIKIGDDDSLEDVVAEMKRYSFTEADLEADEVKLLEDAGLSDSIERKPAPPPPRAPAKPAAAAKPAAPAKPTAPPARSGSGRPQPPQRRAR